MELDDYQNRIAKIAQPLITTSDLDPLINKLKDKKIVMLGEATHGSHEFYEWRKTISQQLIEKHGFNIIAVEADWPACARINRCIHQLSNQNVEKCLQHFSRWPTWMWGNQEVVELIEWLLNHNRDLLAEKMTGFYGLDIYSIFDSIDEVISDLSAVNAIAAQQATEAYACFRPFCKDEVSYVRSMVHMTEGHRQQVEEMLAIVQKLQTLPGQKDLLSNAWQNARIVVNAEKYYSAMINADEQSWNIREKHMMDTLSSLLENNGPESKAIVWEHNTHIGDHRLSKKTFKSQVNLGGLACDQYGEENVGLVGFGTYKGMVTASNAWEGATMDLPIPPGRTGSLEEEFHLATKQIGHPNYYVLLDQEAASSPLYEERGHRVIGVVYHPGLETRGSYLPTILPEKYDAFIYLDETTPLFPRNIDCDRSKIPETYPFNDKI